jgi:hypothetical protein
MVAKGYLVVGRQSPIIMGAFSLGKNKLPVVESCP